MNKTELYFGRNRRNAEPVTDENIEFFIRAEVDPQFKGFTLIRCNGSWEGQREAGFILVFLWEDTADDTAINSIRSKYCKLFAQDSVLRVDYTVNVSF